MVGGRRSAVKRTAHALALAALALAATSPAAAERAAPAQPDFSPFASDERIDKDADDVRHRFNEPARKVDSIIQKIFWKRDGLDFTYRSHPTLTAVEAYSQRQGNCLSLVNLFVAMARSAGLKAFFVEVEDFEAFYRVEGTVVRSTHVVGGTMMDGRLRTVDFLPDRDKRYRRLTIINDARATAHYYNAIGAEAMLDGDTARAEELFGKALATEPSFPDAWNNFGVLLRRTDRLDEGIAALEKALAIDHRFLPAMENLSGYYRLAGRPELAAKMDTRAIEEKTRNPFYLNEQAFHQLQRGRLDDAENMLRRSRRLDSKIPETFLLLGRVELARGDKDKAEALFAKAQHLSETYSDAFQNGLNSKIQKLLVSAD